MIHEKERPNPCNCICDCGGEVWQISDHLNQIFNFKSSISILKYIFDINKTDNFQSRYISCSPGTPILNYEK